MQFSFQWSYINFDQMTLGQHNCNTENHGQIHHVLHYSSLFYKVLCFLKINQPSKLS